MNRHDSIGGTSIKNEKMNLNFKSFSRSFSEKSEINDIKSFARFFLQGELMRQFLLDEDIWLFIQNVKIKLKEDPNELDKWLDNQLHLAKTNAGNFFNSDIPPFHHIKKNIEYSHVKIDKDFEKNGFNNNDMFSKSKFTDSSINAERDTKVLDKRSIIEDEEMNRTNMKEIIKKNIENKEQKVGYYKKMEYGVNTEEKNYDFNEKKLDSIEINNNRKIENEISKITVIDNKNETNNVLKKSVDNSTDQNEINKKDYMKRRKKEIGENDLNMSNNYKEGIEQKKILIDMKYQRSIEDNKANDLFNKKESIIHIYQGDSVNSKYNKKNDLIIRNNNSINNENNNDLKTDTNYMNDTRSPININKVSEDKLNEKKKKKNENKLIENKSNEFQFRTNKIMQKETEEEIRADEPFHLNRFNENGLTENRVKERNTLCKSKISRIELSQNKSIENKFKNDFNEKVYSKNNKINENKVTLKNINKKSELQIIIPKVTVKICRLINEDTDIKLKKIFSQCNNQMNLETFENVVVVNFLKIGRYMSNILFSKIDKVNNDFITYENLKKFFYNRFIDGEKDPSYYDDEKYKNMFKKGKKDLSENYYYNSLQNEYAKNDLMDENEIYNFTSSQKGDHIEVPFKKCSIINFFNAIRDEKNDYLEFRDFDAYVREILRRNTSLQFLLDHAEFLERYIESVIVRLYYHIDMNDTNKIYLNDLRKSDLAHVWCCLDDSIKVQHVRQYFSYSHFYVYYCTFCQTSSCKDMLIDDNDLYRFDNHSLNDFIVNRIWSRISMKLAGPNQKYMCLNDWIYFIMNYEDMTSNRSIEFWFKLIDLDADRVIRDHEIQVFFNIQMERLKSHYLEEPKFEDWLCQMNDAIQPSVEGNFTLSDFKKNKKYAAKFFGCLVSLSKLLAWESRDVHKELQIETEFPFWTPWEIFCKTKYDELCYIENESCYDENFDNYENYDSKNFYILNSD